MDHVPRGLGVTEHPAREGLHRAVVSPVTSRDRRGVTLAEGHEIGGRVATDGEPDHICQRGHASPCPGDVDAFKEKRAHRHRPSMQWRDGSQSLRVTHSGFDSPRV
ncbi:MAG: hypothetical protein SangKO_015320 [Sandaracinaceae bacterium]